MNSKEVFHNTAYSVQLPHIAGHSFNGAEYFSCIDHFLGNQRLYNVFSEPGVINSPDNHFGIFLFIKRCMWIN